MKNCLIGILFSLGIFTCFASQTALSAEIETNSPYYGTHMLITNTSKTNSSSTGTLPMISYSQSGMRLSQEEETMDKPSLSGKAVQDIVTVDGETLYQAELEHDEAEKSAAKEYLNSFQGAQKFNMQKSMNVVESQYIIGKSYKFYALDNYKNTIYSYSATHMYQGTYCDVFVEKTYQNAIGYSKAAMLGKEFDDRIAPILENNFGEYIKNTDGKVYLVLLDIRDDFYYGAGNTYIGGYFTPADLYSWGTGNQSVMLNLDIYPLLGSKTSPDITKSYSIAAHEFEHLINASDYIMNKDQASANDLWWDEAFAMAAEHMLYRPLENRMTDFRQDTYGTMKNGSVLAYTNYSQNNDLAANYGMAYLFGQYLRTQTKNLPGGGDGIYKEILASKYSDSRAIMQGLKAVGYSETSFSNLERNFRIATVCKEYTGVHGFAGEHSFMSVSHPLATSSSLNLKPGTSVIKKLSYPFVPSGAETVIRFIGFGGAAAPVANYPSGEVPLGTEITLNSSTSPRWIRYTTDGTDPANGGNISNYNWPIRIYKTTVIKAQTCQGMGSSADSKVSTFVYYVTPYVLTIETNTLEKGGTTISGDLTVKVTNPSISSHVKLMLAITDRENRLVYTSSIPRLELPTGDDIFEFKNLTITGTDSSEEYILKIMLLDGATFLQPLAPAITIPL